jgi:hypothetical protein
MGKPDILSCIKSLKNKNSVGFNRIPQRIIVDGADVLIDPLTEMFHRIYLQRTVPELGAVVAERSNSYISYID